MRILLLIILSVTQLTLSAQSANQILWKTYDNFSKVKTFKSKVHVDFNIPSINIDTMSGRSFFKAPSKFRVKFNGIAFLPKDNPFLIYQFIKDSTTYIAILNGTETVQSQSCKIINVIPQTENDVIMAKFWISTVNQCPLKMQITSKSNGVIMIENFYGSNAKYGLPDKSIFTIDMKTFKVPKMVSADINSKSKSKDQSNKKTSGTVIFKFSAYVINTKIDDKVFTEK
jgi:hypothetical protein